jgi:hypothetical protein
VHASDLEGAAHALCVCHQLYCPLPPLYWGDLRTLQRVMCCCPCVSCTCLHAELSGLPGA